VKKGIDNFKSTTIKDRQQLYDFGNEGEDKFCDKLNLFINRFEYNAERTNKHFKGNFDIGIKNKDGKIIIRGEVETLTFNLDNPYGQSLEMRTFYDRYKREFKKDPKNTFFVSQDLNQNNFMFVWLYDIIDNPDIQYRDILGESTKCIIFPKDMVVLTSCGDLTEIANIIAQKCLRKERLNEQLCSSS